MGCLAKKNPVFLPCHQALVLGGERRCLVLLPLPTRFQLTPMLVRRLVGVSCEQATPRAASEDCSQSQPPLSFNTSQQFDDSPSSYANNDDEERSGRRMQWSEADNIRLISAWINKGLEYLHETASPPVIYRDLKPSNILLDEGYNARLSDFGLAKLLAPTGKGDRQKEEDEEQESSSSSRVMGMYGYRAPEYLRNGQLTVKSDVYSFGVVLLELITGRRAMDSGRAEGEQSLVGWAAPMVGDQKRFHELVDPLLLLHPCSRELNQAVAVAAMCLQEDDSVRPIMTDVVMALSFLVRTPANHPEG